MLAAPRLSRGPDRLPRLEAALVPLDDGRRPPAERRAERRFIRTVHRRVADALDAEEERAWEAERNAEAAAGAGVGAAEMAAMRLGLAPKEGTPPEAAAAMRAAGELRARLDDGRAVEPGATTAEGWTAVARLGLEGGPGMPEADLWALLRPGGGGAVVFAAAGAPAPEVWSRATVREELEARRADLAAAEDFLRAAGRADPAARPGRAALAGGDPEGRGAAEKGAVRRRGD